LKIKLNDQERRALGRALVERRARLIESTGDTTQTRAAQRAGLLELSAIASVLRKLRREGDATTALTRLEWRFQTPQAARAFIIVKNVSRRIRRDTIRRCRQRAS
jgi:hypothetical protein